MADGTIYLNVKIRQNLAEEIVDFFQHIEGNCYFDGHKSLKDNETYKNICNIISKENFFETSVAQNLTEMDKFLIELESEADED